MSGSWQCAAFCRSSPTGVIFPQASLKLWPRTFLTLMWPWVSLTWMKRWRGQGKRNMSCFWLCKRLADRQERPRPTGHRTVRTSTQSKRYRSTVSSESIVSPGWATCPGTVRANNTNEGALGSGIQGKLSQAWLDWHRGPDYSGLWWAVLSRILLHLHFVASPPHRHLSIQHD